MGLFVDIILGAAIGAAVIAIIVRGIMKSRKGETSCNCGCSGCSVNNCGHKE